MPSRKKLFSAALIIIALLVAAAALRYEKPDTAPPAPPPTATAHAQSSPRVEKVEEIETSYTQTLKGRDFRLRVSVNGNDSYRNVEVDMDDGKPVALLGTLDGQAAKLENITFNPNDRFKLVKLIPGDDREQIVCEGSAYLSRGEGLLETYIVYRIEGDRLRELMSVIMQRDREEGNGPPAQKLDARIEPTTQDGKAAFIYRVKAGAEPERTIVFIWNGERFEDTSGAYEKIHEEYSP
ncbi:hypothetical protein SAMN05428959_109184 [Duganella sp. CF517]|uniref:hypothetical protein n=1 Tax=Duganella sp. CF517 TaxID=1881038 RepID=UPI0008BA6A15|nr:hypothetical protein [Duganella sp. CF517]SEO54061.1 hypothetical protein SAMN05428959_109184 [Duganella sp. CF517]